MTFGHMNTLLGRDITIMFLQNIDFRINYGCLDSMAGHKIIVRMIVESKDK